MAALTHYSKVDATQRTSTATAAAEVTQYTVAWSDLTGAGFAGGDDVLLLYQASIGGASTSILVLWRAFSGTTFAGATILANDTLHEQRPVATGTTASHNAFWFGRHTLVANDNIYFSLHSGSANTARVDDFSFIVIKLADLTENVDYKYAKVDHGVGDAPTTYGTTGASVTIPSASQDWLALAHVHWFIDDTVTSDAFTALNVDGTDRMEQRAEGKVNTEDLSAGIIDALVSPANGATVQARFRVDATSHDAFTSKVFILRLGVFENAALVRSTSTITHSALDTFQEFASPGAGAFTLTTTGDVGFFAQSRHVSNEVTKGAYGQLQLANADIVTGYRRGTAMGNGAADQWSVTFALVAAMTAGTLDIDFDIAEDFDITPNYSATEHSAVVFSFKKAEGAATVVPAVIPVLVALPTPAILAAAVLAPAVIPVLVSLPTPLIAAAATVTPATIAVTAALPTPSVLAASKVTPAVIPLVVTLPTPVAGAPTIVSPAVVAVTVSLPTPSILAGAKVTPAVIPLAALLPTPTATDSASSVVTPAVIAVTVGLPTPTASVDAVVTPAGISLVVTLPTPGVTTPGLVTPAGISLVVTLPTPLATVGAITFWEPDPVAFVRIGPGDQPPWN